MTTLFVCVTCKGSSDAAVGEVRPGARLLSAVQARNEGTDLTIVPVECLSNCERSCTAAVSAPGKWTYVIGHLDPDQHAADILSFARLHHATVDGLTVWRERPLHIRKNTIARVPPHPSAAAPKELA